MPPAPRPPSSAANRWLWLMLAAVIGAFISATALSQYSARRIDELASSIAMNAAPSVRELSAARTDLRHLESLVVEYVASPKMDEAHRAAVGAARRSYADHVVSYLNIPVFPGERDQWSEVSRGLDRLDDTVARILTLVGAGQLDAARHVMTTELHRDIDAASSALRESIDFNVAQTARAALEIERIRSRVGIVAYALDVICAILTVAAGILLRRLLNRSTAIVQAHASELERRNRELEMFSARVAHDIVGPLAAASTALELAEARGKDDAKSRAVIGAGKRSVARVRRIVDALLDFARSGASPAADVRADLDEVLRDALDGLRGAAEAAGIELVLRGDTRRAVRCSQGALISVVSNLVGNAIKYMDGAVIRRVEVFVRDREGFVRIEVADTGPGLPIGLEHQSLFEPYVRSPNSGLPGLGLGLATVRRVVRAHGGEVGVESAPGQGSVFWFELQRCSVSADAGSSLIAH